MPVCEQDFKDNVHGLQYEQSIYTVWLQLNHEAPETRVPQTCTIISFLCVTGVLKVRGVKNAPPITVQPPGVEISWYQRLTQYLYQRSF